MALPAGLASLSTGELAELLLAAIAGAAPELEVEWPVYLALRGKGRLLAELWSDGPALGLQLAGLGREPDRGADLLEIAFSHDYRPVVPSSLEVELPNRQRGLRGIRLALGSVEERLAPSRMIAANLGFMAAAERFCRRLDVEPPSFSRQGGRIWSFAARTILVPLDGRAAVEPYRAGLLVRRDEVTPALVLTMAREMAGWLVHNTDAEGRVPYKYWPSRGAYSKADNTIRQFMATVCLGRIAAHWGEAEAADAARRNLAANLGRFLEMRADGVGMIAHDGSAKLGAAALAALAILEQEGLEGPHGSEFAALARGVEALWQPDGSFRTFHYPAERNDNQNFYPGEALLFWSTLWARTREPALLERCLASFRYYRGWHRAERNPAFVPWHTQAYAQLYRLTGERDLLSFIFEMNDWLLPMQQGPEAGHPDLIGRFYDPEHPEYGPPHASSTGVYLEGLADALDLARGEGDEARAVAYASTIQAGIRSLRQLQFKDEADMFYVGERGRVAGAVRTNPHDNTIRVDNVQHGLMALLKLLALGPERWQLG